VGITSEIESSTTSVRRQYVEVALLSLLVLYLVASNESVLTDLWGRLPTYYDALHNKDKIKIKLI